MMLFAQALIVAWIVTRLLPRSARLLALPAGALALLPLSGGVSAAMVLRGFWGDPSVTTLQLLIMGLIGRAPASLSGGWRGPAFIAALGLLFYPLALGLGDVDPYRFGFQPWALTATLGAAAIITWQRGEPLYLWLLAIDLAAWATGLPESTNLWDTLLDPLLTLAALVLLVRNGLRNFRTRP